MRDVLVSGWLCHALHFVVAHTCTTFCRTFCVPFQISPKRFEKKTYFLCRDFKKEKWVRFCSTPVNWIWSCAHRSFLLPHSSEYRSRRPLERSILGIRWKSQGCIYLCLANAMTWAPESEPQIYSEISRSHLVENHFFHYKPFLHHRMVTRMHFVVSQHWLLIHHQNPQSIF